MVESSFRDGSVFLKTSIDPHPRLQVRILSEAVGSTQDVAKDALRESNHDRTKCLAIIATEQTNGRGTQGRKWESSQKKGNLYLTIAIPQNSIQFKLTLLPLQIASIVARVSNQVLRECCHEQSQSRSRQVTVKWPNDVLIRDEKLSGTLIESVGVDKEYWFLIGIGVNVLYSPSLSHSPGLHKRSSTCLQEHCKDCELLPASTAELVGQAIANDLVAFLYDTPLDRDALEAAIIGEWKSHAVFGKSYEIRGSVVDEEAGLHHGDIVVTKDIQDDGLLVVVDKQGKERVLAADYMF